MGATHRLHRSQHDPIVVERDTAIRAESERGRRVRASLEREAPDVKAIEHKMRRGDLSEMSIGFRATKQDWNEDYTTRVIHEVSIHRGDVSIVSAAASPTSTATLRSALATLEQRKRMAERIGDRLCGPTGFAYDDESSGSLTVARTSVPVRRRSYIEIAKARRAKLRRGERRNDTSPFGEAWAIKTSGDVAKAVREVELGRAAGNEAAIKAWIVKRAGELGANSLIPSTNWGAARSRRSRGSRAHPGSAGSVEGEEDRPRYTPKEVEALGKRGLAFKRRNGTYSCPIVDRAGTSGATAMQAAATPLTLLC